jgi:hypothetical protein
MEPRKEAIKHLESASAAADGSAALEVGIATVFALLHLADSVRHGLRDIIYELRS